MIIDQTMTVGTPPTWQRRIEDEINKVLQTASNKRRHRANAILNMSVPKFTLSTYDTLQIGKSFLISSAKVEDKHTPD